MHDEANVKMIGAYLEDKIVTPYRREPDSRLFCGSRRSVVAGGVRSVNRWIWSDGVRDSQGMQLASRRRWQSIQETSGLKACRSSLCRHWSQESRRFSEKEFSQGADAGLANLRTLSSRQALWNGVTSLMCFCPARNRPSSRSQPTAKSSG